MLAAFEDDEEAWFNRAQLADNTARVPFFKALLRLNPLHPGATHELVHFYENYRRPALGWPYAEAYIASSPGLPHAFHMQAHLGTRIGKWEKTSDWSARAIELEKAYHRDMNVAPRQDSQYGHHLETLLTSLIHDGRFKEARAIQAEARGLGYRHLLPWFRLHLAERDWAEALKIAQQQRSDAATFNYLTALVHLKQGNLEKASTAVAALKKATGGRTGGGRRAGDRQAQLAEVEGWLRCRKGEADAGLKLLAQAVERTRNDYGHHAWGNGALYMETWGIAALQAGKLDVAEEAFLEALAHDRGSVRGALGMQVVCERQGRTDEAARFAALARRCWARADPGRLEAELAWLRGENEDKPKAGKSGK
jgi:tetratricopeptide (TPR) repeat protein